MHPLKDQREGVKYGRGIRYGVTPVCADRISNYPLVRILTYKNLIYLLNVQFLFFTLRMSPLSYIIAGKVVWESPFPLYKILTFNI